MKQRYYLFPTLCLVLLTALLGICVINRASAQSLTDALNPAPTPIAMAPARLPIVAEARVRSQRADRQHRWRHEVGATAAGVFIEDGRRHSRSQTAGEARNASASVNSVPTATQLKRQHRLAAARKLKSAAALSLTASSGNTVSIDSMTRDGGAPDEPQASGQGINIVGAVVRWALSLGAVLALAAGAIVYLRKKGYGSAANATPAATPIKPAFGMSPLAQLIMQRPDTNKPAQALDSRASMSAGHANQPSIENLQILASGSLPGSSYTLYKIRVDDRVLLLAGSPGASLSVLTEWDVQAAPPDDRRFDAMLEQLSGSDSFSAAGSHLLQSASQRLERTTLRVAALGRAELCDPETR